MEKSMSVEYFEKFAITYKYSERPDGKLITVWNVGQILSDGNVKWSKDASKATREEIIAEGKRMFG
jgi:hypothetical protein